MRDISNEPDFARRVRKLDVCCLLLTEPTAISDPDADDVTFTDLSQAEQVAYKEQVLDRRFIVSAQLESVVRLSFNHALGRFHFCEDIGMCDASLDKLYDSDTPYFGTPRNYRYFTVEEDNAIRDQVLRFICSALLASGRVISKLRYGIASDYLGIMFSTTLKFPCSISSI